MSFSSNASRFAFLVDDAPDPFETVKRKGSKGKTEQSDQKAKKPGQGTTANGKKKSGKSGETTKALQSMAFGGGTEGKKKKAAAAPKTESSTTSVVSGSDSGITRDANGASRQRPEGVSEAQWQEWQKRDLDYVSGTYESDLEAALMQSKLDFQEQARLKIETQKTKSKKKPIPVSLTDFNAKLNEGNTLSNSLASFNGPLNNGYSVNYENPEEVLERFREEAQREIEREKQISLQRQILLSRNQVLQPVPIQLSPSELEMKQVIEDKNLLITSLTDEKALLLDELDKVKSRVKKLCSVFSDAQLKEKALLVNEVEKLSKLNSDLNEEVKLLHSQLEQEKSRARAALLECRKLVEQSRRRNNTEASQ